MNRSTAFKSLLGLLAVTAFSVQAHAASVTVNTETDANVADSECSLREAIESVNTNVAVGGCVVTGGGLIDSVELPSGTYNLTITGNDDNNAAGDLDVLASLTLNGAGAESTIISAAGLLSGGTPERVLHINPQGADLNVALNGVTIRDGNIDDGGGILIEGDVKKLVFQKLGIFDGTFTLVTLNAVNVVDNNGDDGGGILNDSAQLVINDSLIARNAASFTEDGGGILSFAPLDLPLQISNSVIEENVGTTGAGIAIEGSLVIDSSTIANNVDACAAAGIFVEGGEAFITNSTISGNRADGDCAFDSGGGENVAGGIGINSDSSVIIVNSTISQNVAPGDGGGGIAILLPEALPPAPAPVQNLKLGTLDAPGLHLYNVTITANETTGSGGGILAIPQTATGESEFLTMANSIVAENQAGDSPDCLADFTSEGYNLIGDVEGCNGFSATGDLSGVAPDLGPLQDNGGPTETHALNEGSPAIDSANPDGCLDNEGAVLSRDQRDETRPVNATGLATAICDRGAFEVQLPDPTPTPTPTPASPFLLNGTGCAMTQGPAANAAPALLAMLAGLGFLAYRRYRDAA